MVHITQLPPELLNVILVLVAMSSDGAGDLARAALSCNALKNHAKESVVLKAVNFQRLTSNTEDFRKHRNRKGLLCLCARAGNQSAQAMMGKALLVQDPWFWGMIFGDSLLVHYWNVAPSEVLHHIDLVRSFILHASSLDVAAMCQALVNYVITYAGYKAARESGIVCAIYDMCSYKVSTVRAGRLRNNQFTISSVASVWVRSEPPRDKEFNRDTVITFFDELFSSVHG
ncbi:unnamed protein product [Lactuca saligna]|uniref:F-box domain-containing protein n=1 Tax=Lactuca saligna TaxID=75948 RepID=A0AA35ZYZ8_LACSI|nr:unnamed protein product [Lactuca saligna]